MASKPGSDEQATPEGQPTPAEELKDATAKAKSAKPVKRNQTVAPVRKKESAKAKTKAEDAKPRTTPALFVRQSVGELKRVNWPTGPMVRQYFVVVVVFVLFIMTFIAGMDWIFGWLMLKALG